MKLSTTSRSALLRYINSDMSADNIDIIISNFEEEIDGFKNIIKYPFDKNIILDKRYIQNTIMTFFIEDDSLNSVCNSQYI